MDLELYTVPNLINLYRIIKKKGESKYFQD
jgi:hypothetical protein